MSCRLDRSDKTYPRARFAGRLEPRRSSRSPRATVRGRPEPNRRPPPSCEPLAEPCSHTRPWCVAPRLRGACLPPRPRMHLARIVENLAARYARPRPPADQDLGHRRNHDPKRRLGRQIVTACIRPPRGGHPTSTLDHRIRDRIHPRPTRGGTSPSGATGSSDLIDARHSYAAETSDGVSRTRANSDRPTAAEAEARKPPRTAAPFTNFQVWRGKALVRRWLLP